MEVYSKTQLQEIVNTLKTAVSKLEGLNRHAEAKQIRPVLEHLQKHLDDTRNYPADYYIIDPSFGVMKLLEHVSAKYAG